MTQPHDFETKILDAAIDFYQENEWLYRAYLDNMEAMPGLALEPRFKLLDATHNFLHKYGAAK